MTPPVIPDAKRHSHSGEVMPPESCDDEIAGMMARLDKLQHWLVLQATSRQGDRAFMSAATLIQDVRVLLVERCFHQPKDRT